TGSSVFDFDGDGNAEVVYADEQDFYILDGRNGDILFQDTQHESNTRLEMPIVVDVDNDGKSEVLVPEAPRDEGAGVREGLLVWADADNNWVRTRRIWNQHSYHVTNVTEDGQIPRSEEPNWTNGRLNNFRQNVQPGGLFDAPDLFIVEIDVVECDPGGTVTIGVTVGNRGALGVAAGVPVTASATPEGGDPVSLGVERTATFLLPGQQETVRFTWTPEGGFTFRNFTVSATVDDDGMGGSEYNECDEENNGGMSEVLMTCDLG
ncbi:MAG TPA: CARDB domain-containing protein, partial [Polyangiaceae bacterium LLY-WYZ-15_(1-7)]|nr:CARDB domain-containing protein [Polyangiaceae bacterium LLY-WYZ-15_(1-7)]